jgi:hypothetical protein
MSFWSSLFGGSNPTLNQGIKQAGQTSQFAGGLGQKLTSQAGGFFSDLLSGDPSKTAKLLAPQTREMRQRAQQGKQALAQFGSRSGGTAGAAAGIDAATRGDINDLVAKLTGSAVTGAASMGQNLIDTGLNALGNQVQMSQQQMDNWSNSILGKGLTTGISAAETYALGG